MNTQSQASAELNGHVLVADDTAPLRGLVVRYLSKAGLSVVAVEDGAQALAAVEKTSFQLVFMDVQMPVMDGITATKQLRANGVKIPIVALTANTSAEDRQNCLNAGCDFVLAKPIQREQLLETVKKYLKQADQLDTDAPIISTLVTTEPDMRDLVAKFVSTLPKLVADLKKAASESAWQDALSVAHKLKGLGGGYGYPMVTDIAGDIHEKLLKNANDDVLAQVTKLVNISGRIVKGMEHN